MSDRIAVFNRGRVQQLATPDELYDRPATAFVATFIGESNAIAGRVTASHDGVGGDGQRRGPPARGPVGRRTSMREHRWWR